MIKCHLFRGQPSPLSLCFLPEEGVERRIFDSFFFISSSISHEQQKAYISKLINNVAERTQQEFKSHHADEYDSFILRNQSEIDMNETRDL